MPLPKPPFTTHTPEHAALLAELPIPPDTYYPSEREAIIVALSDEGLAQAIADLTTNLPSGVFPYYLPEFQKEATRRLHCPSDFAVRSPYFPHVN